jgi:hypothetical protein
MGQLRVTHFMVFFTRLFSILCSRTQLVFFLVNNLCCISEEPIETTLGLTHTGLLSSSSCINWYLTERVACSIHTKRCLLRAKLTAELLVS